MSKLPIILHASEIEKSDESHYPGSDELLSYGSPFGEKLGLKGVGIWHDVLKPGRRSSWPHAHSAEDEFVFVIEGEPDVWIDGELHSLKPGHGVGFPAGTGIAHTFINNTDSVVRLLVVGEKKASDKAYYPLHPIRKKQMGGRWWETPKRTLGPHDGLPDRLRNTQK